MAGEVAIARSQYMSARTANVRRSSVKTTGGETEKGYSTALKRSILPYESRQRMEENEALAFYDDKGNQLKRLQGKKDRVDVNKEDVPGENLILTHNHPWALSQSGYMRIGSSFSLDDALMAVRTNAKEIRAVTPTYTFSIKRKGDKWGVSQSWVRRAFEQAKLRVLHEGNQYVNSVGYSKTADNRYTITYWHKVNKLVAKELGWN